MHFSDLTKGERLFLTRTREGKTVAQAAKEAGVSPYVYRQWEADRRDGAPNLRVGRIQPHEQCLLKRRRAGLTQAQVAQKLGVCPYWLRLMEKGRVDCTPLAKHWKIDV